MNRKKQLLGLSFRFLTLCFSLCLFAGVSAALNKFDGVTRNTENYAAGASAAAVYVYTLSGNTLIAANGLQDCNNAAVSNPLPATVPAAGYYFCFQGSASTYYISYGQSGTPYLWLSETNRNTQGVYSLEEFGATRDTVNNTYPLKNAVAYIGSRPQPGGKLLIPNGVFKVGAGTPPTTLPGFIDVPRMSPIAVTPPTLPVVLSPGITIEGTNGRTSYSSSRIQIDTNDTTIFKIGGATDFVTLSNLGLVASLYAITVDNAPKYQYRPGSIAVLANGPVDNPSQNMLFSGLTIQGFEKGLSVNDPTNGGWQFDYVKVDNSVITDCLYPIHLNTYNTDWIISNSVLGAINSVDNNTRGSGLWLQLAGTVSLQSVFSGSTVPVGTPRTSRPEAFVKITGPHAPINISGSESEGTENSILYAFSNPWQDTERFSLHITGSLFGDPIKITQNVALVSEGNTYLSNTVQVLNPAHGGNSTATQIYSFGDTFSGVTYDRQICAGTNGQPMGYGLSYTLAPAEDCRRDFYIYNSNPTGTPNEVVEANTLVSKTSQRRSGLNDSSGLDQNHFQFPMRIASPPSFDSSSSTDKFKYWGYSFRRNTDTNSPFFGFLELEGNQKAPEFSSNKTGFRLFGSVYPSADNQFELGNQANRWSLLRAVTVTSGDTILSDKKTGKELYKIHEDENYIYFQDIRTGKELMKLDTNGNLIITGKIYQAGDTPPPTATKTLTKSSIVKRN